MSELTNKLLQVLEKSRPIIYDDARWYFTNDLRNDISKVQDCLAGAGVRPGDRILLSFPNSYKFVVIYLAIIDYGAVVVPINPNMPEYEFMTFIQRCRPISGFIGKEHSSFLLKNKTRKLSLESFFIVDVESPINQTFDRLDPNWLQKGWEGKILNRKTSNPFDDYLAVLLYTSGTTGNPKAVGLTHGQILTSVRNIIESHELTSKDITYCFLPLFHINAQVVSVLSTLLSDGKIVIAKKFSGSKFWNVIREQKVTWVSAVPAVISILLKTHQPEQILTHLRFIRSASSQLPILHARRFEKLIGVPVIQSYGMTEAASQICVNPLPPKKRVLGSVGLPVGVKLKIVDMKGKQCPPEKIGEIVIQGKNTINYYVEADNQNDFRGGWFHTGDLGYVNKEGYVFIVGRLKEMINRGGEKISPYEVEEVIRQIPVIQDAAVIGMPHPLYGEQVVTYVVCQKDQDDDDEIIRTVIAHCKNSLSSYKSPTEVFVVNELPVGPTGKIQRTRLKELGTNAYQDVKPNHMR